MISVINPQTVTLDSKVKIAISTAAQTVGSDFNTSELNPWLGDKLTVESLFPQWILKAYENDTENVMIIPIIKQYFRWLFSQEYGYGAQLNWENIRVPLFANAIFLEALADYYFPNADFSTPALNAILPNIRQFAVKSDSNYFNIKGTPSAIKYVICSLLGFNWNDVFVYTNSGVLVEIRIASAQASLLEPFKPFLVSHVIPAGSVPNYTTF